MALAPGTLRVVTPEHLRPEVTASVEEELEEHLAPGMRATLVGLKNAAMNGKAGRKEPISELVYRLYNALYMTMYLLYRLIFSSLMSYIIY